MNSGQSTIAGTSLGPADRAMLDFLDGWIELKRRDQTLQRLYDYWVLGKTPPSKKEPRWSVVRNVLGWVE